MDHSSIIRSVADTFLAKGYTGHYTATSTGSSYHLDCFGRIEEVLDRYFQVIEGKTQEDIKPLSLQTFLKWNGLYKDYIRSFIKFSMEQEKPMVLMMETQKWNSSRRVSNTIKLTNLEPGSMPSLAKAIKMVSTELPNKPIVPNSKKFRL